MCKHLNIQRQLFYSLNKFNANNIIFFLSLTRFHFTFNQFVLIDYVMIEHICNIASHGIDITFYLKCGRTLIFVHV